MVRRRVVATLVPDLAPAATTPGLTIAKHQAHDRSRAGFPNASSTLDAFLGGSTILEIAEYEWSTISRVEDVIRSCTVPDIDDLRVNLEEANETAKSEARERQILQTGYDDLEAEHQTTLARVKLLGDRLAELEGGADVIRESAGLFDAGSPVGSKLMQIAERLERATNAYFFDDPAGQRRY